jgi:hypothetical protein
MTQIRSIQFARKPLRVTVRDALFVGSADEELRQKRPRLNYGLMDMVGGEHDPLHAAEFKLRSRNVGRKLKPLSV